MNRLRRLSILTLLLTVTVVGISLGQRWRRRSFDLTDPGDRNGVPLWELDTEFKQDTFTFARVRYSSLSDRGDWGKWNTDFPDSDLKCSLLPGAEIRSFEVFGPQFGDLIRLRDPHTAQRLRSERKRDDLIRLAIDGRQLRLDAIPGVL